MTKILMLLALLWLCFMPSSSFADEPASEPTSEPASRPAQIEKNHGATTQHSDVPVVTEHELKLAQSSFKYKATAGFIPLKDAKEKPRAKVFFIAYARSLDEESERKD